jgi:uncharacterized protein (TIGR03067 family)
MKTLAASLAAAVLVLLPADPNPDDVKKEIEQMQGTWSIVSVEIDGIRLDDDATGPIRRLVKDDTISWKKDSQTLIAGSFKIDPSEDPKTIDFTVTEGGNKGETILGIYESSEDEFKVCWARPNGLRPTEFSSNSGNGYVLNVFKRVKEEATRP